MTKLLEVCVDEARGIAAAVAGGADRIELCSALALGGLTPSGAMIRAAAQAPIPVHLLARPREGGFRYDREEAALVAADITAAAEAGLAGVVIGASARDHTLDTALLSQWIAHARALGETRGQPLSLTLHRAIDLCPDLLAAQETAIALGFDRILTSGGKPRAVDAVEMLARLVGRAEGRITILAGSGVTVETAHAIVATGVPELHASCSSTQEEDDALETRFGFQAGRRRFTDAAKVSALKGLLSAA